MGCGKCEIRVMPTKPSPKITPRTSHISPLNYNLFKLKNGYTNVIDCVLKIKYTIPTNIEVEIP